MPNNKLKFLGIGPKIARVMLPWLAVVIFLSVKFKSVFTYFNPSNAILFTTGIVFVTTGLALYFATLPLLLKGLRETRLVTEGAFKLCVNPLYASILILIIPGASFLMNSWLMLTVSIAGYVLFKIHIQEEYREMENFFGESYVNYRKRTSEFLPMIFRKK